MQAGKGKLVDMRERGIHAYLRVDFHIVDVRVGQSKARQVDYCGIAIGNCN